MWKKDFFAIWLNFKKDIFFCVNYIKSLGFLVKKVNKFRNTSLGCLSSVLFVISITNEIIFRNFWDEKILKLNKRIDVKFLMYKGYLLNFFILNEIKNLFSINYWRLDNFFYIFNVMTFFFRYDYFMLYYYMNNLKVFKS